MKRFQMDRPIMIRRWRIEWEKHGRDFGNCHCGRGMGTMRKHRPYESHASSKCRWCHWERIIARLDRRRERYAGRRQCLADEYPPPQPGPAPGFFVPRETTV